MKIAEQAFQPGRLMIILCGGMAWNGIVGVSATFIDAGLVLGQNGQQTVCRRRLKACTDQLYLLVMQLCRRLICRTKELNSNGGWNVTSSLAFLNMPILQYSSEIRSAVLLVHGEKAHSRYFSETAYSKLTGDNKELLIIPGANHTDLYDRMDIIPFEKLKAFFAEYLK